MQRCVSSRAFSIIQALMAMAIVVIAGMASVQTLVLTNRKAASMRTLNNARAIVQRNIDTALGVPFSAIQQPAVLALTSTGGAVYDEDGDGDNNVKIALQSNGTTGLVNGTLTRIVTAEPNSAGADIRRITFRIDYTLRSRASSFSMTTLRATD